MYVRRKCCITHRCHRLLGPRPLSCLQIVMVVSALMTNYCAQNILLAQVSHFSGFIDNRQGPLTIWTYHSLFFSFSFLASGCKSQRDDNSYLESALSKKILLMPTIFQHCPQFSKTQPMMLRPLSFFENVKKA